MSSRRLIPFFMLFAGACATHIETQGSSSNEAVEESVDQPDKKDPDAMVDQDLGLVTAREKKQSEFLRSLEAEELNRPSSRAIASTETVYSEDSAQAEPVASTVAPVDFTQRLFDAETVTVKPGQTLQSIAKEHLGVPARWTEIAQLNPQVSVSRALKGGEKLFVPKSYAEGSRSIASVSNDRAKIVPFYNEAALDAPRRKLASENAPQVSNADNPADIESEAGLYADNDIAQLRREKMADRARRAGVEESDPTRGPASVDREAPADGLLAQHGLSRLIAIIGCILFIGVFLSFLFAKPARR